MSESNGGPVLFKVNQLAVVPAQIRSLAEVAKELGKLPHFIEILKTAVHRLARNPKEWGDPLYSLALPGGVAYRAVILPISFRYAVFAHERTVMILEVRQFAEYPA